MRAFRRIRKVREVALVQSDQHVFAVVVTDDFDSRAFRLAVDTELCGDNDHTPGPLPYFRKGNISTLFDFSVLLDVKKMGRLGPLLTISKFVSSKLSKRAHLFVFDSRVVGYVLVVERKLESNRAVTEDEVGTHVLRREDEL